MTGAALQALDVCGTSIAGLAAAYLGVAAAAMRRRPPPPAAAAAAPAVTVLKPLCGVESATYDCLRSFCEQRHPRYQIVFGVQDPLDPAQAVVQRLQQEYPGLAIDLVVDARQHGANRKVGNLINMLALARHDHLVIADSDIRVGPDYLEQVVAPLRDPGVGIVTCAYRGVPQPGLPSLLGALFINDWFLPSVRVAAATGSREFAFGATIALRREALRAIGGFEAIADHLADDYQLGELTRAIGLATVLSEVVVETVVNERSLGELVRHDLRWLRTIRAVRPVGYALSGITFGVPVAAVGVVLARGAPVALATLGVALGARFMLHLAAREAGESWKTWLALPLGDVLSFALWCWGFAARSVRWRQDRYLLTGNDSVTRL